MTAPTHAVRVRYVDCDMQGIVYNAHYLTFVDDAFDTHLRSLHRDFEHQFGWEVMVKRAEITWDAPARFGDVLDIRHHVSRWGTTSFDVAFVGVVGETHVFDCTITYVVVDHAEYAPMAIPDALRAHIGTAG